MFPRASRWVSPPRRRMSDGSRPNGGSQPMSIDVFERDEAERQAVRQRIGPSDFSLRDRDRVCRANKISGEKNAYHTLTSAEKWRCHAYMRVRWWNAKGAWPPPFDTERHWLDPDFAKWAFNALAPRPPTRRMPP